MILPKDLFPRLVIICAVILAFNSSFAQKKEIAVTSDGSMKNVTRNGRQVIRYNDNVKISHEGATMYCDSAYLLKKDGLVEAFSHVKIVKDETTLYGDYLYYNSNTSTGKITGREVKMIQKDATLTTDIVHFNSKNNSAFYTTGGILLNKDNNLKSKRGYYYSDKKKYYFSGNVELVSKDGKVLTDSLVYGSETNIANFFGPTRIYNEDNFVYCENGWYDRENDQSNFSKNAYIITKEQKIYGQDIFYDKKNKYSKIVGQVAIFDSTRNITIFGGKANYWDDKGEAEVTDNPLIVLADNNDTLFLKANILLLKTIKDNSMPDSLYRIMRALGAAKFYKSDVQGLCDTLIYDTKDSTISMISNPVLWNDKNQITANFIKAFLTAENKIKRMEFEGSPMMSSKEDKIWFNQIKGKSMVAKFQNGKINKLDVTGNGQTVYFVRDNGIVVTVNRVESSDLTVSFKNNNPSRIIFKTKPVSTLYPISKVDMEDVVLKGFKWLDDYRPKSKLDIIPKGVNIDIMNQKPLVLRKMVAE
ncbi:MAG: OstA-like protein [Tenuifilaceae bacterium]